ncbi:glycosyltransferase [Cyanobium sp. ATX-6F1]|uniref:glycosyltransferase n=1 Tax=Cyanobium sp. ATX-6F1 TaxID=3137388 RepID=UPI0039BDE6E8
MIPALNEALRLPLLLADLAAAPDLLRRPLVVDGGSGDGTPAIARLAGARVISSPRSRDPAAARGPARPGGAGSGGPGAQRTGRGERGAQRQAGGLLAAAAPCRRAPRPALAGGAAAGPGPAPAPWCFQLRIEGSGLGLRLVEGAVALRTRLLHRPYGDQGLLIPSDLYRRVGGYRPWPLMEDLDLVQRLAAQGPVRCLGAELRVDGRRWRRQGVARTAWRNWQLRRAWRGGVSLERLAQSYYGS